MTAGAGDEAPDRSVPAGDEAPDRFVPFDVPEFSRWRSASAQAVATAQLLASAGRHSDACFHAEQAAQLALKGLLHGLGLDAWGHDLVTLGGRCAAELGGSWPAGLDRALMELSRHYIPTRYPDAHPGGTPAEHYGTEDSEAATHQAGTVLDAVGGVWDGLTGPGPG
ncbi:MAG: HEPN domain-containing protein [Acidimicrobiales bacterium]